MPDIVTGCLVHPGTRTSANRIVRVTALILTRRSISFGVFEAVFRDIAA